MATTSNRYYITTPAIYSTNMYLFIPGFSQSLVLNGTYSLIICNNFTVIANQVAWEGISGVGTLQDPNLQASVTFTAELAIGGTTFTAGMLAAITAKFPGVIGSSTVWDLSAACTAGGYQAMALQGSAAGSSASAAFSSITSGVNDSGQALVVGSTSTLSFTGTGVINANELYGVVISATPPVTGQFLVATSSSAANWQTVSTGSGTVGAGTAGQVAYYSTTGNTVVGDPDLTIVGGALTLGIAGTDAGSVILCQGSTNPFTITVSGAQATASWVLKLPATAGTSNQVLATDGAGNTFWSSAAGTFELLTLVDFGFQSGGVTDSVTTTVTGQTWVTSGSKILCNAQEITTADHDPDDYWIEKIVAYATNLVPGVGFDIVTTSAGDSGTTWGKWYIASIGL